MHCLVFYRAATSMQHSEPNVHFQTHEGGSSVKQILISDTGLQVSRDENNLFPVLV